MPVEPRLPHCNEPAQARNSKPISVSLKMRVTTHKASQNEEF